jgi:hypothetical protein
VQQETEPVVVEIAESVPDSLDLLDQQVDRFGGALDTPPVPNQANISLRQESMVRAKRVSSRMSASAQ